MAIDRTGITSLDTGASDITYTGDQGPKSPDQMLMAFADPMLVNEYKKYVFEMQEQGQTPISFKEFVQQVMSGMAEGGRAGFQGGGSDYIPLPEGPRGNPPVFEEVEDAREFMIANPGIEDVADYEGYYERLKRKKLQEMMRRRSEGMEPMSGKWGSGPQPGSLEYFQMMTQRPQGRAYGGSANPTYTQSRKQRMAYGGIAGADGRKKYGIGSFFQDVKDKFVDDIIPNEIKENPLMSSVLAGTLLNQYGVPFTGTPGDRMGQDWFSNLISGAQDKAIQQGVKPLSMHTYDSNIQQIDIRPGDVSQKVGIGDKIGGAIGNVAGALGSGIGALGSGLNWLGESAGQLIGDVAGGAGEVARKGLATILPGGDPGYVPDGLYRTAGQLLNPFSTASAYEKVLDEKLGTEFGGKKISASNQRKTDSGEEELSPWRKAS